MRAGRGVEAEQHRLPLSYFESTLAVPSGWVERPNAYVAFGDTYADEAAFAREHDWPTVVTAGRHLHMLTEPDQVAATITIRCRRAGGEARWRGFDIVGKATQTRSAAMKYLILIRSNERSRAYWDTLSDEQMARVRPTAHGAHRGAALTRGELVTSEGLADVSLAKRVAVRDGQVQTTDGPFAEAKEYAAGFYVVDCESEERVIEIAAETA